VQHDAPDEIRRALQQAVRLAIFDSGSTAWIGMTRRPLSSSSATMR
jgi:hypothetical protein